MENKLNETLIDLSVDIYQKCPTLPNHPPMVLSDYQTHKTIREAEGVKFSCASMYMSMGEHTGTHVDAFNHFDPNPNAQSIDQMALENFYTDGICLDLSHKPLKSNISIEHLEYALSGDNLEISPKDTNTLVNLACVLKDSGNSKQAERFLKDALKINPSYDFALTNLGAVLNELKKFQQNLGKDIVPSERRIEMEVSYNKMNVFMP